VLFRSEDSLFADPPLENALDTGAIDDGNNDPTGVIGVTSDNVDPDVFDLGDTISINTASLQDADGLGTFSYQWMRSGEAIVGANSDSYQIGAVDEGHRLTLVISYTDVAGFDETVESGRIRVEGWTGDNIDGTTDGDVLTGTDLNDRINGKKGADVILGGDGQDRLIGSGGDDVLSGGQGRDKLVGGKGDDNLTGGQAGDVFIFKADDGNDLITDFEDGLDRIRIKAGASEFSDLTVTQEGDDVLVVFASTTITLEDTQLSEIGADDFLF